MSLIEVSLATPDSPTAAHDFDLLILDSDGIRSDRIDQIAKWLDDRGGVPMLVIVDDEALGTLRLPNHAHADFVCPTATPNELKARAQRLMGEETSSISITRSRQGTCLPCRAAQCLLNGLLFRFQCRNFLLKQFKLTLLLERHTALLVQTDFRSLFLPVKTRISETAYET